MRIASVGPAVGAADGPALLPDAARAPAASADLPTSAARPEDEITAVAVSGRLHDGRVLTGRIGDLSTSVVDGILTLAGTVAGSELPAEGSPFSAEVKNLSVSSSRSILLVDLAPFHLEALDLVVDPNPVSFVISGESGAEALLDTLLGAVTGLLDRTSNLALVSQLFNQLLTGLGL